VAAVLVDPVLVDLGALPVGQPVALVLAQNREVPPGKGEEFGKASPIGLVVLVVLFLATILLVRSMNKHLRRVPASFDPPAEPTAGSPSDTSPGSPPSDGAAAGTRGDTGPVEGPARD
jgi:hypothetical protein